jgi:hypothetical protein
MLIINDDNDMFESESYRDVDHVNASLLLTMLHTVAGAEAKVGKKKTIVVY